MSTLTVGNGYRALLSGLGRNRGFEELSQKRITKKVREALRQKYGLPNVAAQRVSRLVVGRADAQFTARNSATRLRPKLRRS